MEQPFTILLVSANRFDKPYPVFPIGVWYLNTHLRQTFPDAEIKVFDAYSQNEEELKELLHEFKPRYTCVSLRNVDDVSSISRQSFIEWYETLVQKIRSHADTTLIIGGAGFSIYPELLFDRLNPDYAVKGEGETSLTALLTALNNGTDFTHIEGLLYRTKDKVVMNPRSNYCQTPALTMPDEIADYYWKHSGMLSVQTKRGCPYQCIYCSYPVIEGRKVRTLSPKEITNSLRELYEKKGINYVFFTDSVFNIDNKFNIALAKEIIATGLPIKWGAYFSIKNFDYELLEILKKSGLTHVEFGTESLSDHTLKHYQKPFTFAQVKAASELCEELDVDYVHFLILGGHGETEASLEEGFQNSKLLGRTAFFPFVGMRIYPGTKLREIAVAEGVIDANDDLLEPKYYLSKDVDVSDLEKLKARGVATGKSWVWPDADMSDIMRRLRARGRKGPLWEYSLKR